MIRAVVFDVDDTLYLERDYAHSGFLAVGAWVEQQFGTPGFAEEADRLLEAGHRGDIFNRALEAAGQVASPQIISELVRRYREHTPSIELLPDALATIETLARGGVPMAGITDGPAASQRRKVHGLGIERWLTPIIVTGEYGDGFSKPHPRAFEDVARALELPSDTLIYIGDNPTKDFQAPNGLGWQTARIRRPGGLHYDLPDSAGSKGPSSAAGASHITHHFSELSELLPLVQLNN